MKENGGYSQKLLLVNTERVSPAVFHDAIKYVVRAEFPGSETPNRELNRFEKIDSVFVGREDELISLTEFGLVLQPDKDGKNQRKYASTEISHLNLQLEKYRRDVEIETITITGRHRTETFCRLRNVSRN